MRQWRLEGQGLKWSEWTRDFSMYDNVLVNFGLVAVDEQMEEPHRKLTAALGSTYLQINKSFANCERPNRLWRRYAAEKFEIQRGRTG